MNGKLFAVITSVCLLAISCTKHAAITPGTTADTIIHTAPVSTAPLDTFADNKVDRTALLQLVNGLRSRGCNCGGTQMPAAPALTWNGTLEKAAWLHSKDMKENNYFDHTGRNGSSPGSRLDAAGYHWNFYGENIANGNMDEQAVVLGWLHSPLHCQNMMSVRFHEMGVGKYDSYWTMELGSK